MFFVTVKYLMPKAVIIIRHIMETVTVNRVDTRVKGFRILLSQNDIQWAIHAVLLADPVGA